MSQICKTCGTWYSDDVNFCRQCGTALDGGEAPKAAEPVSQPVSEPVSQPVYVRTDAGESVYGDEEADVVIVGARSYESPAADARDVRAQLVGAKADHYLPKFEKMEQTNSFISWNWPAFLIGAAWMLYRKMYVIGAVVLVAANLINAMQNSFLTLLFWLFTGLVGNFLYMKDINRRVEKVLDLQPDQRQAYLDRNSGTSFIPLLVAFLVLFVLEMLF